MTDERDIVNRREDFKRFIVFCLASLVVIAQTAVFAYIWYDYYRGLIFEPFWRKGNWVLIAIYGLINVLFSRLYGGLKVGYLKRIDVFYSLTLATICTNIVTYFQIVDQPMVPETMANDRDDTDSVCDHPCMDMGFQIYLFKIISGKETSGDLWRP